MLLTITITSAQNSPVYLDFEGTLPATGGAGSASLAPGFTHVDATAPGTGGATVKVVTKITGTQTTSTVTQVDNAIEVDPNNTANNLLKMDYQGHVIVDESVLGTGSWTISGKINGNTFGANPQYMGFISVTGLLSTTSAKTNRQLIYRYANGQMTSLMTIPSSTGFNMLTQVLRHFSLTYDASDGKFRMYRDGVLAGTSGVTTSLNNVRVYLGYRGGSQDDTTGALTGPALSSGVSKDLQMRLDDLSVFKRALSLEEAAALFADPSVATTIANVSWDGSESSEWTNGDNWSTGVVPTETSVVTIPAGMPNQPVVSASTGAVAYDLTVDGAATLTVQSGGSLIVSNTSTGNVTYNVAITDTNWHLATSPVSGEGYDDAWVTANSIASGSISSTNRGIATYQNGTADATIGNWVYVQGGASGTYGDGVGYSLLSSTGTGNFSFTGTINTSDISPAISQDVNYWNLIGNSYTSYLDVAAFITANVNNFGPAFQSIYVWNGSAYVETTTGYVYPGQAFFVSASATGTTASFTTAMQSHQTTGTIFLKSSNTDTSIELNITDGTSHKTTKVNYLEGKTEGLDPGFDIGMFNGVSSDLRIYTHLVNNNEGIAFARQVLPTSNIEVTLVPVGLKAAANQEITFSAEALNLPSELKVFLEDRQTNTFTRLDEENSKYEITLSDKLDGAGRFFIHTSTSSVLSIDNTLLEGVSVYKTNASTLRIVGLSQGSATVKLFNILGKQMMNTSFETSGSDEISLSNLATGIYIVQLETENGKLNKKIILE